SVPIGRPIPGARVHLLDGRLEPVPIGVPGELYVGGGGVAQGYLSRPERTAEAFLPDPWSGEPGARLYRTGDLARLLPDGTLDLLGRADRQVKVRGYRIEPGEIEAALVEHVYLRQSAVVVQEPAPGDRRLLAFVVPEPGEVVLAGDLRAFLKQRLPPYMVPAAIVALDALPLTPNGKVDRRALQAMRIEDAGRTASATGSTEAPPRDDLERRLAAIWEEVLSVRPIGVHEPFFDLGGHSLLTVRLVARVEREFGHRPPLSLLFREGTIAAMADDLRQDDSLAPRSPVVALSRGGAKPPFYCIHPLGGTVLCYGALASCLDAERPFYGLEAPGLRGEASPATSIESLAAHHLEALRERQNAGPYLLGGWSSGGTVAYEMACQLAASGQEVALLALIDSHAPGSIPAVAEPADTATLIALLAREMAGAPAGSGARLSGNEPGAVDSGGDLDFVLEQAKERGFLPADLRLADAHLRLAVLRAHLLAMTSYRPGSYPGRIHLLRAADSTASQGDLTNGWRALAAAGVEVNDVPGDHYSVVREPHVRTLAARLESLLEVEDRPAP
ncbi:MAG TPA: thioesterase domain-containing protein, partial [Thermoanaerobaculia bacterium]